MQEYPKTEYLTDDNVELKEFAAILWRRKWLIVFVTLFAATSAFVISRQITPVYEASTTLIIDQAPSSQASENSAISASERLARTYAQLLTKRPVMDEARMRVELSTGMEITGSTVRVQLVEQTQLIELKVQDTNPVLASELANAIVEVFTEQNAALQTGRFAASKASLAAQLDRLGVQIQANEAAIANLGAPRTSTRIAELERLQSELTQYQISYTNLLQSYEEVRTAEARTISNVIQVEPAEPPNEPIRPRIVLNTLLAGVVGGAIALGLVFLNEHLDDTIRTVEDVERILQIPVLGSIALTDELSKNTAERGLLAEAQSSGVVEPFRSLQTNIEFLGNPGGPSTLLVASLGSGEGKTTVASHLAATIGNGDKKVVLIDADFRRPGLHEIFGVRNEQGLSDMLFDHMEPQGVAHSFDNSRLNLITSGRRVDDPAELLGSTRLLEVLVELEEQFDVLIFDGPPFLATEALILASRLRSVLLVIQPGQTSEAAARRIVPQLRRARADLIGAVLNKVPKRESYGYLYYGYDDDKRELKQPKRESRLSPADREDTRPSITDQTEPPPSRPPSILEPHKARIDQLLRESEQQPRGQRYTTRQIYQLIQADGYSGSLRTLQRYASGGGNAT